MGCGSSSPETAAAASVATKSVGIDKNLKQAKNEEMQKN